MKAVAYLHYRWLQQHPSRDTDGWEKMWSWWGILHENIGSGNKRRGGKRGRKTVGNGCRYLGVGLVQWGMAVPAPSQHFSAQEEML